MNDARQVARHVSNAWPFIILWLAGREADPRHPGVCGCVSDGVDTVPWSRATLAPRSTNGVQYMTKKEYAILHTGWLLAASASRNILKGRRQLAALLPADAAKARAYADQLIKLHAAASRSTKP